MTDHLSSVQPLSDLVEYQDGSVVSRVVFRNDAGVMTAFAFAQGQGLTEHSSPHDAIVQVVDGRARITIGREEHELEAGDVLHLPPSIPHALHGGVPFKILLTILKRSARPEEEAKADTA
ncbi:MAG: cupin domain-containing protein [Gemmatimonadetes bacterium]|nr:cupin domain-containing protein [Gemmatimonadota bacterium]